MYNNKNNKQSKAACKYKQHQQLALAKTKQHTQIKDPIVKSKKTYQQITLTMKRQHMQSKAKWKYKQAASTNNRVHHNKNKKQN